MDKLETQESWQHQLKTSRLEVQEQPIFDIQRRGKSDTSSSESLGREVLPYSEEG